MIVRTHHNQAWKLNLARWAIATSSLAVGLVYAPIYVPMAKTVAIAQSSPLPSLSAPETAADTAASAQRPDQPLLQLGSIGPKVAEVQAILSLLGFYTEPIDGRFGTSTAIAVRQFQTAAGIGVDGIVGPGTWSQLLPTPERLSESSVESVSPQTSVSTNISSESALSGSAFPVPEALTRQTSAEQASSRVSTRVLTSNLHETMTSTVTVPSLESLPTSPNTPSTDTSTDTSDTLAGVGLPVLRRGMRGTAVAALQQRLKALELFAGAVDGIFGPQTEAAVMAAQRQFQLNPDGIVGVATWTALVEE